MKTAPTISNNLINETIFPLKVSSLKTRWVIFWDNQFMLNTHSIEKILHYANIQLDLLHLLIC